MDGPPLAVLGWGTHFPQEHFFPPILQVSGGIKFIVGWNTHPNTCKGAQFRPISKEWIFIGMMCAESSSKIVKPLVAVISCKISTVRNCNLILENYQIWVDIRGNASASWSRFQSNPQRLEQKPLTQEQGDHKAICLVWGDKGRGSHGNFQSRVPCLEVPRPTQSF